MRKYCLLGLSMFIFFNESTPALSQHKSKDEKEKVSTVESDPKYIDLSKKASHYFAHSHYHFALPLYLQLKDLNPDNYEINYRMGICYLNTNHPAKAISFLENAKKFEGKANHLDLGYYLARAHHLNHEFDKAIDYYNKYIANGNPKSEVDIAIAEDIQILIKQCQSGKLLCANPVNITIEHLGSKINGPYSEENPLISADGKTLYFSSGRPTTTGGKYDFEAEQYFHDIYVSHKIGDQWSLATPLKGGINTVGNDAPVSITSDSKRMYLFTSINGDGDIDYSDKNDSTWSNIKDMGELVNSPSFENGGSISADGQTFYFSSDREQGLGGYDIYKTVLQGDGKWGTPVNLGPGINTELDDADPFLLKDGKTLYFSSKGYNSIGGYDLFASKYDENLKAWSSPLNMGYPINTADDEVSISWSSDGKIGYFSEVKEEGLGNEDIYSVNLEAAPKVNKVLISKTPTPSIPKKATTIVANNYSTKPKLGDVLKEQVHFAFNESHTITDFSKSKINSVIGLLNKYPDLILEIEGFAEDNSEYSSIISKKRADAVYEYLSTKGVNTERLKLKVYKENQDKKVSSEAGEKDLKGRRVEFKVVGTNGTLSSK